MFYISSRGSSATNWLTRALLKHPKIVCFRASRSFPPIGLGQKDLAKKFNIPECSPDFFIKGLIECEMATFNEKNFGSMHGYHGTIAKKACEENNGHFAYITRHPLDRIHSALIYYLDNYYNKEKNVIKNRDIHKHLIDIFSSRKAKKNLKILDEKNSSNESNKFVDRTKFLLKNIMSDSLIVDLKNIKKNLIAKPQLFVSKASSKVNSETEEVFYIYNLLSNLLDSFFVFEEDLIKNCSPLKGIKMEEMVRSPDYFREKVFNRLTPSLDIDKNFVLEIFNEKRQNTHRENPISSKEIWESLPEVLRELFLKKFYKYEINSCTTTWNYDVSFL